MNNAKVILWGNEIGAVTWLEDREIGVFQYFPEFVKSGIQVAPLMMPLRNSPFDFPALARNTFIGLPGLLSDSLPDKFGNAIIDAWLASENRSAASFHPVERLCYVGKRGMGALEFKPTLGPPKTKKQEVDIAKLVGLSDRILNDRRKFKGVFNGKDDRDSIVNILRVGTSAGGARAKAILTWNHKTNEFRSGQVDAQPGFEHWLMKFDGVSSRRDSEMSSPKGYGKVEYAYHLMAVAAGIEMTACRLHHEGGRSHFMTKRFDRTPKGRKLHMQSLGAIAHFDYRQPSSYSYEQAIQVIQTLGLPRKDIEQMVLRACFNVVGKNCDDHVKNIAFLMDRRGEWRLAPAFDVTYAWNPSGEWTSQHQMSVNNKRDHFTRKDLLALARMADIKTTRANEMIDQVISAIRQWPQYAEKAGLEKSWTSEIRRKHLTKL